MKMRIIFKVILKTIGVVVFGFFVSVLVSFLIGYSIWFLYLLFAVAIGLLFYVLYEEANDKTSKGQNPTLEEYVDSLKDVKYEKFRHPEIETKPGDKSNG